MLQTALHYSHTLLEEIIIDGSIVVDATMGNGNDTAFLAKLVGERGHVYSFDIQSQAIENTTNKLNELSLSHRVTLFQQGHETIGDLLSIDVPISAAIFNLGYLPKSDKTIITIPKTTEQGLNQLIKRLIPLGRIILVVYYGHEGGQEELNFIKNYCAKLPQKEYNVLSYHFINQQNNPPILYCIEKKKTKQIS